MFVEITSDLNDAWKAGTIVDLKDDLARSLIGVGQAKESTAADALRASNKADLDKFKAELLGEIRSAIRPSHDNGNGRKPSPPTGGGGVDFGGRIDPGEPAGKRSWAELLRAVHCVQATDTPPELRDWGRNLLGKVYSDRTVSYKVTEDGGLQETIERSGISITRTGTESISGGPTYGFLVKPEWSDTLFRIPIEDSVIEPGAFEVPIGTTLEFKWPALDQYKAPTPGQSAAYAGFVLSRKGEITKRDYSDGATKMIDFKITDLTAFTTISRDLEADAYIRIDAMISQVLGQAFQWRKDYEYFNGTGIGQPLGIMNAGNTAALTVNRGTSGHIEYEDIVAMMAALHSACWREACWVCHQTCLKDLVAIHNHAGSLVYQPNSLISQAMRPAVMQDSTPYNQLMYRAQGVLEGFPVYITEKVPPLGTRGDFSLIHRRSYGVAARSGLEVGLSEHFLFDTDTIAYRFKLRNDARPLWLGPYIQSDGGAASGNTKVSPFVILN
jgi:HK97 family phage major capsid protein